MIDIAIIDDERNFWDITWINWSKITDPSDIDVEVFRTPDKFLEFIEEKLDSGAFPRVLSFDNDLGHDITEGHKVLHEVLYMMIERGFYNLILGTTWVFHSQNPIARDSMHSKLDTAMKIARESKYINER